MAAGTPHRHSSFLLSVLVPVFNEQGNIQPLLERLVPVIELYNYEIVFVDDGSRDETAAEIKEAAHKNTRIKLISFARNFGHQIALTAGYRFAKGNAVASIDADLEDPPELIHDMVKQWQKGYHVVYAKRAARPHNESPFKKFTALIFYKIIDILSDTPIPQNVGDYRLIDRAVVDMLNVMPEKARFLRGLVAWGGFSSVDVPVTRGGRTIGQTHYSLKKMLTLALDGIISFSTKPLRWASYVGFTAAFLGLLGIIYALYRRFLLPEQYWVEGWTATFVGIMFFGGMQLLTIGIIGEYIARMYTQLQGRPDFLIRETVNI